MPARVAQNRAKSVLDIDTKKGDLDFERGGTCYDDPCYIPFTGHSSRSCPRQLHVRQRAEIARDDIYQKFRRKSGKKMPSFKERTPNANPLSEPLLSPSTPDRHEPDRSSMPPFTPSFTGTPSTSSLRLTISPKRPPHTAIKNVALLASACLVAHFALTLTSLISHGDLYPDISWSKTKVVTANKSVDLYPSNFWTNVDNFSSSGAKPLSYLLLLTGVGQPVFKALILPLLLLLPIYPFFFPVLKSRFLPTALKFTPATARRLLLGQEFTSKLTTTTSNVGVVMLNIITLTFRLKYDQRVTANAITDTLWGTVLYLYAGQICCVAICLIREIYSFSCNTHGHYKAVKRSKGKEGRENTEGNIEGRTVYSNDQRYARPTFSVSCCSTLPSSPPLTPLLVPAIDFLSTTCFLVMIACAIPSFSRPLVRFTYSGVAAQLIDDTDATADGLIRDLRLVDIGDNLYHDTPDHFIALNNAFFFYLNTFVCPAVTIAACIWHRLDPSHMTLRVARWAFTLSMLDTVVVAFFFAAPEIDLISEWVFDGTTLCETLEQDADDKCLDITGEILAGGWYCAAVAVLFDLFVVMMLYDQGRMEDVREAKWVQEQKGEARASLVKQAEERLNERENRF